MVMQIIFIIIFLGGGGGGGQGRHEDCYGIFQSSECWTKQWKQVFRDVIHVSVL